MIQSRTTLGACALLLNSILHQTPAWANDQWKAVLELQLDKEKSCQVIRYSGVQVYELLGKMNIRAEAHCVDGRVYTATRSGSLEKFHLTICPTRC